jgi:hypothetical protein
MCKGGFGVEETAEVALNDKGTAELIHTNTFHEVYGNCLFIYMFYIFAYMDI